MKETFVIKTDWIKCQLDCKGLIKHQKAFIKSRDCLFFNKAYLGDIPDLYRCADCLNMETK